MVFLIVALQCEAQSLIHHLRLKRSDAPKWRVYNNEEYALNISGTGKVRSAMAATYLYSCSGNANLSNCITVNIGLGGSTDPEAYKIGDLVVINQVRDHGSHQRYFPDMLLKHTIKEAGLETFDHPVTCQDNPELPIVDMEASGFFEAASCYFTSDRIFCLKLISDYLEGNRISPATVTELFKSRIADIHELICSFREIHRGPPEILNSANEQLVMALGRHLKFSATQQHQLRTLTEGYLIRRNSDIDFLKDYLQRNITSKYDAKKCFNTIKSILNQP